MERQLTFRLRPPRHPSRAVAEALAAAERVEVFDLGDWISRREGRAADALDGRSEGGAGSVPWVGRAGAARGYAVVVACHVILVLPFVLRSVYISLRNLDPHLEQTAASLGASPGRVLRTVTLPLLVPGLASGWLFAAILSFNEFTASLFVTAQQTQTLPVAMYNYVREYADPTMAAISVIFIVLTATLLALANAFLGLGKVLNVEQAR